MLKMIVADDEPVITRGIKKLVDWKSLGIEINGEYEDGLAALDGILTKKPDIALLDINMPHKSGIEILKELKNLEIATKVIFISGFQDFQYAKDALTYGAVDYLLKPVIREELIGTIEKCMASFQSFQEDQKTLTGKDLAVEHAKEAAYDKLLEVEKRIYLPVLVGIIQDNRCTVQEKKLVFFSVVSYIEDYLSKRDAGIVFVKKEDIVMVIKDPDKLETGEFLSELAVRASEEINSRLAFIIGGTVGSMGDIPEGYEKCRSMAGYFFFADQKRVPVFRVGEKVYRKQAGVEDIKECRQQLTEAIVAQDEGGFSDALKYLKKAICEAADGRKDDACFHYTSTIRIIEERLEAMGLNGLDLDFKEILVSARAAVNYQDLAELFDGYFCQIKENIRATAANNDKREIYQAREYIESHYMENLTLEIMAEKVHMNPYYFSGLFKKKSGENFKDYLNKVRMEHARSLLLTSDKKTTEIAEEVGFREVRSFSDTFQKLYGETPSGYRKRVRVK